MGLSAYEEHKQTDEWTKHGFRCGVPIQLKICFEIPYGSLVSVPITTDQNH